MSRTRIVIAVVLAISVILALGVNGIMSTNPTSMAAAAASGAISGSSASFTWTTGAQCKVHVANLSTSGVILYVRWNETTAAATGSAWDHELLPGQEINNPDGKLVDEVAIYSTGSPTYETDYIVKGWQ